MKRTILLERARPGRTLDVRARPGATPDCSLWQYKAKHKIPVDFHMVLVKMINICGLYFLVGKLGIHVVSFEKCLTVRIRYTFPGLKLSFVFFLKTHI